MFIDYLPFPASFLGKPISFVGVAKTGHSAGLRAVEQAQQVVGYRNAYVFPGTCISGLVSAKIFPMKTVSQREMQQKLLRSQDAQFRDVY